MTRWRCRIQFGVKAALCLHKQRKWSVLQNFSRKRFFVFSTQFQIIHLRCHCKTRFAARKNLIYQCTAFWTPEVLTLSCSLFWDRIAGKFGSVHVTMHPIWLQHWAQWKVTSKIVSNKWQKPTSVQYALWSISSISAISGGIFFTISCTKFIIHGILGSTGVIADWREKF